MDATASPKSAPAEASPNAAGRSGSAARDIGLVAVFAALIWVLALMPAIAVPGVGVPITLQTLAIGLTGMVLGPLRGTAATCLYVGLGLVGLPVFSGGTGGFGVLAGPSAGYIVGFPLYALAAGFVAVAVLPRLTGAARIGALALGGLLASILTVHPLGIAGMALNADLPLQAAAAADLVFWPGDIVKNILAAVCAATVHRAFPGVLVRGLLR